MGFVFCVLLTFSWRWCRCECEKLTLVPPVLLPECSKAPFADAVLRSRVASSEPQALLHAVVVYDKTFAQYEQVVRRLHPQLAMEFDQLESACRENGEFKPRHILAPGTRRYVQIFTQEKKRTYE